MQVQKRQINDSSVEFVEVNSFKAGRKTLKIQRGTGTEFQDNKRQTKQEKIFPLCVPQWGSLNVTGGEWIKIKKHLEINVSKKCTIYTKSLLTDRHGRCLITCK